MKQRYLELFYYGVIVNLNVREIHDKEIELSKIDPKQIKNHSDFQKLQQQTFFSLPLTRRHTMILLIGIIK